MYGLAQSCIQDLCVPVITVSVRAVLFCTDFILPRTRRVERFKLY